MGRRRKGQDRWYAGNRSRCCLSVSGLFTNVVASSLASIFLFYVINCYFSVKKCDRTRIMFGRDFYSSQKSINHNLNLEVVRGQSRVDIRPLSVSHHRYSKFISFSIYLSIYLPVSCYWHALAWSNFDHYARECEFGILKKKNNSKHLSIYLSIYLSTCLLLLACPGMIKFWSLR